MKPRNFPARRLARQLRAAGRWGNALTPEDHAALESARAIRTAKDRSARGKRRAFQ